MEFKELKEKTDKELHDLLKTQREEMRDLRFKVENRQLKNVRELRNTKRLIARILTLMNGRKEKKAVKAKAEAKK